MDFFAFAPSCSDLTDSNPTDSDHTFDPFSLISPQTVTDTSSGPAEHHSLPEDLFGDFEAPPAAIPAPVPLQTSHPQWSTQHIIPQRSPSAPVGHQNHSAAQHRRTPSAPPTPESAASAELFSDLMAGTGLAKSDSQTRKQKLSLSDVQQYVSCLCLYRRYCEG